MKVGAIFFGFLFLINPDLMTLDPLPDFVGYLLISHGLFRLSFLEERVALARRWCQLLACVSVLKLFANLAVFSTNVESTRMTISFFFFVGEAAMLLLMVDNAFKGIQYLAVRRDGDLALKGYEVAKFFVTLFCAVKCALSFLPSAVVLLFPEVDADPEKVEGFAASLRSFRTVRSVVFVIASLVVLFLGIYVARILRAYLARCRSDRAFCESLAAYYKEKVSDNESMQTRLAVKGAFLMFFVSFLFLADLYLDDISFIPLPFFFLFVFLGFQRLRRVIPIPKLYVLPVILGFFVSLAGYFYRLILLFRVDDFAVFFVQDPVGILLGVLSALLIVLTVLIVLQSISRTAKQYLDYPYGPYAVCILLMATAVSVFGFLQYRFPSTFGVLPMVQWALFAILCYFHKKCMDEISSEIEYRLM